MRVVSKIPCGFRRDGRILLQKGENVLEEPIASTEMAFIKAMEVAGVVKVLVPEAPSSETRMKAETATSTRVDVAPSKKPMRTRGAPKKARAASK